MQKKRSTGGGFWPIGAPSTFQGFPPISAAGFSTTLPIYVGARANIWGMETVPKDKFKKDLLREAEEEKKKKEEVAAAAAAPKPEPPRPVPMLKTIKKEPKQKKLSLAKPLSPEEKAKLEKKMRKLSALADPPKEVPKAAVKRSPIRRSLSSDSDTDSDGGSRPITNESGRHSPSRMLRPPSPADDDMDSLGNAVTPLKPAPKRKAVVMVQRSRDVSKNAKYIPKKVNLPRQMSHLFRSDAAALTEVAAAEINEMSYLEIPDWHKYIGEEARLAFLHHYETAYRSDQCIL